MRRQHSRGGAPTPSRADAQIVASDSMSGSTDSSTISSRDRPQIHGDADEDADDKVVSCTVVYDHRFVRLRIAAHDTVESLVELTKIKLRKKYPNENLNHAIVGLRSQRLEKGAGVRVLIL